MSDESRVAWGEFLSEIEKARRELKCSSLDPEEAWFRGHTNSQFKLMPSLFRTFENPNTEATWDNILQTESDLFWEFAARARQIHGTLENHWDILFAMQHYGTPTRLLDWTETLAVAVYFAILDIETGFGSEASDQPDPCIWVLNPYRLNENEWGGDLVHPPYLGWSEEEGDYYEYSDLLVEGYMEWDWPTAIYASHRTDRIQAQNGWFTIHGDEFVPLESVDGHERFLRKVTLPRVAVAEARRFLQIAGVNHFTVFADLESLSLHLKEKNRLISPIKAKEAERARVQQRDAGTFHSCYLSYSSKDEEFARRLYGRLREANVPVWFWPENMRAGEAIQEQVERAIKGHDKLLIVFSESSLQSEWVMKELRLTRQAERQSQKRKLFPVSLTDLRNLPNLPEEIRELFIRDFSRWKEYDHFEATFAQLLKDLKAET